MTFDKMMAEAEARPTIPATKFANKTTFEVLQCCANRAPNVCDDEVIWYAPGTGWAFCHRHFKEIYPAGYER